MRKQNESQESEKQQTFKRIKIGISQHIVTKDIEKCHIMTIYSHGSQVCRYAVLTNHQIVYFFDHQFNLDVENNISSMLEDECQSKINLRMDYKLPPLLHIKMVYSYNSQCIFTILNNGKIATFTEELYYIGTVEIACIDLQNSIKHCLDFQYFQKQASRESRKIKIGYFTFLFTDNIQLHEVQITSNHKLSKFKPSYKINLVQMNKSILDSSIRHPDSIKGFYFFRSHLFSKENEKFNVYLVISCNCKDFVVFYFINKITMIKQETVKIAKGLLQGSKVGDSEISIINKRFFLGMSDGTIKAISFKQENINTVLYSIKICSSSIMKLYLQENEKIFAFAKDNNLYLINLHNLSVEQRFKLGETIHFIFINQKYFLTIGHPSSSNLASLKSQQQQQQFIKTLFLIQFNCSYHKIHDITSQILQHTIYPNKQLVHYSDHSLLINDIVKQNRHIQTYLPPRAVSVKCIAKNMFGKDQEYWILTDKSEIYKYKVNEGSIVVSEIIELYRFLDYFGVEHRYIVTYFCFLTKIVPIVYDSQTTFKESSTNNSKNQEIQPICFGTKTGEILIVSNHKILNILFRTKSLSTSITNIIQVHPLYSTLPTGLIIYQSHKSQKTFIISVSNSTFPSQLFRLDNKNSRIKSLNNELFVIYQQRTFSCYYCKHQQSKPISLFREEHYNFGFHQISKITSINLISNGQKDNIVVGSSLGQIFVYIVHKEISKEAYLYLNLLYVVQISKEEHIKYLRIKDKCLVVNLGDGIVQFQLQKFQEIIRQNTILPNIKIKTMNYHKQFSLYERNSKKTIHNPPQKPQILSSYMPQIDKSKFPKLPISTTINRSKRSLSSSIIRSQKPQFLFHFPDIQLYRSLINKKYIN